MVETFEGRFCAAHPSGLGGPGLEVRKDSPGWLARILLLRCAQYSLCSFLRMERFGGLLLRISSSALLLLLRFAADDASLTSAMDHRTVI